MTKLLKKDLLAILANHQHWLRQDVNGWKKMRANLSSQTISKFDLKGVNLSGAILVKALFEECNLNDASLSGAILVNTRFDKCNLNVADLSGADMTQAKFYRASMQSACLDNATLIGAYLDGAKLSFASLYGTNLTNSSCMEADFSYCDLRNAKLDGCCMDHSNLTATVLSDKDSIRKGLILKTKMIGYKKTKEGAILKAEIPAGAIVFSINGTNCRTNSATILSTGRYKVLTSKFDSSITYRKGQKIVIDDFDLAYNRECASGFHFFRTKKEAIEF